MKDKKTIIQELYDLRKEKEKLAMKANDIQDEIFKILNKIEDNKELLKERK